MSIARAVYNFKGLMAPVFTHFNDDKWVTISYTYLNVFLNL